MKVSWFWWIPGMNLWIFKTKLILKGLQIHYENHTQESDSWLEICFQLGELAKQNGAFLLRDLQNAVNGGRSPHVGGRETKNPLTLTPPLKKKKKKSSHESFTWVWFS